MNIDIDVIVEYCDARALFEELDDVCQTDYDNCISTITSALSDYSTKYPGMSKECIKSLSQFMELLLKVKGWQGTIQKQFARTTNVSEFFTSSKDFEKLEQTKLFELFISKN